MSERLQRLRSTLAILDADAGLISHPANRHYFTGYPADDHAPDESAGVLLVTQDRATLFVSPTNLAWARHAAVSGVEARPWARPWPFHLGAEIAASGLARVAFEDNALTVADYNAMRGEANEVAFVPARDAFHALRAVKDEAEIALIAEAARITDAAFVACTASLEAGVTEKALVWRLESTMRELGADGVAFPTAVAAGPHGARPHHEPTDRPIEAGEPIVIDMGAKVRGYCADLTRTIVVGEPSPLFRERYNSVLAAQLAALSAIRAGMSGREADAASRDLLAAAGYGELFVHGLGHGVGLLIHEAPSLGTKSDDILQPNNMVTVEPGIYEEGWGGIRIEDLCVVTPDGVVILSQAPK